MKRATLLAALAFLIAVPRLEAQIRVEIRLPRRMFISYEPCVANVVITNMTGRDITLHDADGQKWCNFEIQTGDGRLIPARDQQSGLVPLLIPAGETIKRSANLASLFPIGDFGMYRVRAAVYFADAKKFYDSQPANIEVSEGKVLWQQTVGVPEGKEGAGGTRTLTLLSFRLEKDNRLYVRVEDKDGGVIYTTQQLGPILTNTLPQEELDKENQLHILQLIGLKTYVYTRIGLNGETLDHITYNSLVTKPVLRKRQNGEVAVVGGQVDVPVATAAQGGPVGPKLSDRPPGMGASR